MPAASLLTLLLAPLAAFGWADAGCESLEALRARVTICSFNERAVESAKACYDRTLKAWKEGVPADLQKILSSASTRGTTRQEAEFVFSHTDAQKTITALWDLIYTTDANAALAASYLSAFRTQKGLETSCYGENKAALQKLVSDFDQRLKEGLETLEAVRVLRSISLGRDANVGSGLGNRVLRAPSSAAPSAFPPVPAPSGKSPRRGSDITGVKESRQKEILAPFPLRDQLLEK